MRSSVSVGDRVIGQDCPVFIVGEIGINHNGSVEIAKKLIDVAKDAGCDAVKFQKRLPEEAVPEEYKSVTRETPWGIMSYLEYRKRVEFSKSDYDEIDRYCRQCDILWSASCWDLQSLDFIMDFNVPFLKIPSALIAHKRYLDRIRQIKDENGIPLIVSTGMADMALVERLACFLGEENLVLLHAVSSYPTMYDDVNLGVIRSFQEKFRCPVGYSGHETGLQISLAAAALGAKVIERHITLDRTMWGTDQAASLEPNGLVRLVRDVRVIEKAMGNGIKVVLPSEKHVMEKLRKVRDF